MLEVQNIEKSYKTEVMTQHVLKGISLKFRESEFVSILGQSGSGKSTLLNIIGGLDHYDSGDLIIDGISTKEYKDRDWDAFRAHKVGFIFQSYNLIMHQTLLSNVELSMTISGVDKNEKKKRAVEALEKVGLGEHINKKPNQLSGGQMQRVSIARALVNNPSIILADEPTGALDSETSVQIMDLLREIAKDKLVIMVTHNNELADEYSTRIVTLKDGKIEADTNPVTDEESASDAPSTDKLKATVMNYGTCLLLSFQNLFSKKGRTFTTAFASSVGIIGIALIMAMTNGVQGYIKKLERDTLSSAPITITGKSISLGQFGNGENKNQKIADLASKDEKEIPTDAVYVDISSMNTEVDLSSLVSSNNLKAFKEYVDNPESEIYQYVDSNNIKMTYSIAYSVLYDKGYGYEVISQSAESKDDAYGISSLVTGFIGTSLNSNIFSVMLPGQSDSELVNTSFMNSYEVLDGRWPESYDEIVLVLDKDNTLPIDTMVKLGIISDEEFGDIQSKVDEGEKPTVKVDYKDVIGKDYIICPEALFYETDSNGSFYRVIKSHFSDEELPEGAIKTKVTGVIKPVAKSSTSISSGMAYTNALDEKLIELTDNSDVITAQLADAEINVLTGKRFDGADDENADKKIDVKKILTEAADSMENKDLAPIYDILDEHLGGAANAIGTFFGDFPVLDKAKSDDEKGEAVRKFIKSAVGSKSLFNMLGQMLGIQVAKEYSYENNLESFGYIDVDEPNSINIYCDSYLDKQNIETCIKNYNNSVDQDKQITYTDYVKMITNTVSGAVNVVSGVLVALAAISLVVSSIMIGIITHISVMERTREIGILRALGASKKNITQVFSAETFIIGLFSGVIGVVIGELISIPITKVVQIAFKMENVYFSLGIGDMILLVFISVVITVIGGHSPARKAAKLDPVTALRTE